MLTSSAPRTHTHTHTHTHRSFACTVEQRHNEMSIKTKLVEEQKRRLSTIERFLPLVSKLAFALLNSNLTSLCWPAVSLAGFGMSSARRLVLLLKAAVGCLPKVLLSIDHKNLYVFFRCV